MPNVSYPPPRPPSVDLSLFGVLALIFVVATLTIGVWSGVSALIDLLGSMER